MPEASGNEGGNIGDNAPATQRATGRYTAVDNVKGSVPVSTGGGWGRKESVPNILYQWRIASWKDIRSSSRSGGFLRRVIRRCRRRRSCRGHKLLIRQNALHDRRRHLFAIGRVKNLFPFSGMRHVAALDQNRRHFCVTQHGEPCPPHTAIFSPQVPYQRFFHLIGEQQQALIFPARFAVVAP